MPQVALHAPGTPSWVDLASPNLDASRKFYSALFGWKAEVTDDPAAQGYTMFLKNGKQVAGLGGLQMPEQPSAWSTYVATEDADKTAKAVQEAGGKVVACAVLVELLFLKGRDRIAPCKVYSVLQY